MKNITLCILCLPLFLLGSMGNLLAQSKSSDLKPDSKNHRINAISFQISEDSLLNLVQWQCINYFLEGAEPHSGLGRERLHMDDIYPRNDKHIVTIGGSGFGVMAILVGIKRGFISRKRGFDQLEKIVSFLEKADRFHGAWPHWLNGETSKVEPFSRDDDGGDLVETAFMIQGLLCVRQFFREGNQKEKKLAERINKLWQEVEWDWYTRGGQNVLYWHWSPNFGWQKNFAVTGYNECLIMYILAASSPTHSISAEAYHKGWAKGGKIKAQNQIYGYTLGLSHNGEVAYGGPLFWAHYSYLGLDPRELEDDYVNYWEHNKNHVLINRQYCIDNPNNYEGYGENCWGLTSSYSIRGYAGHAPGAKRDLGVITPTAALSSFPYAPDECMQVLKYLYQDLGKWAWGKYGPYDAFSLNHGYYTPRYLAIDQGPIPVMIENHRSAMLWDLFMSCPEIQTGLEKLGFNSND